MQQPQKINRIASAQNKNIQQKQDKEPRKQIVQQQQQSKVVNKMKQYNQNFNKISFLQYFQKPILYTIFLFLDAKSLQSIRRVCKQFNEILIESSSRLILSNNQILDDLDFKIKTKIPIDQLPQVEMFDISTMKNNLKNVIPYNWEGKIDQENRDCLELLFNLSSMNISVYQKKKYTFQMKMKMVLEKYHFDIYRITDQEKVIINQMADYDFRDEVLYNEDYEDCRCYVKTLVRLSTSKFYDKFCEYNEYQKQIKQFTTLNQLLKKVEKKYKVQSQ